MRKNLSFLLFGVLPLTCLMAEPAPSFRYQADPKLYPVDQTSSFEVEAQALGFNVGKDWGLYMYGDMDPDYLGFTPDFLAKDTYYVDGVINYQTVFKNAFLQNKRDKSYFAMIYRVSCSPVQVLEAGISHSSSMNDWSFRSLKTTCILTKGELVSFSPENVPESGTSTVEFGLTIGKDPSLTLGFSQTSSWSELHFESRTNFASKRYESFWEDREYTVYSKNTSLYRGMFIFKYDGEPEVTIHHEVTYHGRWRNKTLVSSKSENF